MEIKTSYGDVLKIENEEYLIFNNKNEEVKVQLKKIQAIGNYLLEDVKSIQLRRNIIIAVMVIFLLIGINLIFHPSIAWENTSQPEVSRMPDLIVWTGFLVTLFYVLKFNTQVRVVKSVDSERNDINLPIAVKLNDDPKKPELINYVICHGKISELREIKQKLMDLKTKSLLV